MITSKLTSKAQTTIPQAVRSALGVQEGDDLAYAIEDGRVVITKATSRLPRKGVPFEDPFAAFWEWDSKEDEEDFADLQQATSDMPYPDEPVAWDVVTVDFPYSDMLMSRKRPAVVLAMHPVHERYSVAWVLMVTSARHSRWPGDIPVTDLSAAGVSRPCYVRTEKIATMDAATTEVIGHLAQVDQTGVRHELHRLLHPVLLD